MRFLSVRRTIVAAGAALALGVAALGVVGAQQGQGEQKPNRPQQGQWEQRYQQYVEALAKRLNLDPDKVKQAMADARQDVGWGKHGGPGGGHHGAHRGWSGLQAAAGALNMSPEELRRALPGHSLAELARSRNVDPDRVANAIRNAISQDIDKAVDSGRLSAEKAREMKQNLGPRINELMNKTWPAGGQKFGPRGGQRQ